MFCKVIVDPAAVKSLNWLCQRVSPLEELEMRECAELLTRWLQYDPNLKGIRSLTQAGFKTLVCGPLYVWFKNGRPIERRVTICGYGRNVNWTR
jgi:hypothetical protein